MSFKITGLKEALLALALFFTQINTVVFADNSWRGCEVKKAALERELGYARQYGNRHHVRGLEQALTNVNAYCTEDSLREDLDEEIAELEDEVTKRELELREAVAKGDSKKIAKREEKLARALEDLAEKQAEYAGYFN